jgi:hypothetical protein
VVAITGGSVSGGRPPSACSAVTVTRPALHRHRFAQRRPGRIIETSATTLSPATSRCHHPPD